ncbi:MAG TPA: Wzz/FepE/Etk N-terminal domain-containing protein [Acidimicrobiales bacterium]|nr:Wzz/FepE/Etk N-terminal domain-containing protein [Acidimicrobiales bacterium]
MTEQLLDIRGSLRLIRRHWRTVAVFALVGLLGATAYLVVRPPSYHATSLVLLPGSQSTGTSGSTGPSRNGVTTDGKIATSAAVLAPAGKKVDPDLSLAELQSRVSTSTAASGVLGITATGTTAAQAEALSNAVANGLIQFVTTSGSGSSAGELAGLQAQETQLQSQISDVQKEIDSARQRQTAAGSTSAAGQQAAALVGQLTSEQTTLQLQLDSVKSEIGEAKQGVASANEGTVVIQQATTAQGRSKIDEALVVVLGLLAGAFVGGLVVLAVRRRDPRLWTRDEVASAVGSPVVLSLEAPPRRTTKEWAALLARHQPTPQEEWNVRRALRELGVGEGGLSDLLAVSLDGDVPALVQVVKVAVAAAGSGLRTELAMVASDEAAAGLEAACGWFRTGGHDPRRGLVVTRGLPQANIDADLRVLAVVADPAEPVLPTFQLGTAVTVLSVSSGYASIDPLARVSIAAVDAGAPVRGVLVANPGSEDVTAGRIGAGTPTSLAGQRRAPGEKQVASAGWLR